MSGMCHFLNQMIEWIGACYGMVQRACRSVRFTSTVSTLDPCLDARNVDNEVTATETKDSKGAMRATM